MKRAPAILAIVAAAAFSAPGAQRPALAPAGASAFIPGPLASATNATDRTFVSNAIAIPRRAAAEALLFDARAALPEACGLAADAIIVPAGEWILSSNRFVHADADICRALVWRLRRGVSTPNPPVTAEHGGPVVGYVETAWSDERGVVARIRFADAAAATNALWSLPSAEVFAAASTTIYGDRFDIPLRIRAVALVPDPALPTKWASELFTLDEAPPIPSANPPGELDNE